MMVKMLTAKEMQALLEVDRSTVYRMAEDGRLPALKVGRQWRFPANKIDSWLAAQEISPSSLHLSLQTQTEILADQFPFECIQMMQDAFADALGIMLIITDMAGKPLTQFSNACGLFEAIDDNDVLLQKCMVHWREMADSLRLEPKYVESYLGLLCSRAFIRVGTELKGMVFVGGIAPPHWPPPAANFEAIAQELAIEPQILFDQAEEVYFLSPEKKRHILVLLQKIANVVSHILHERNRIIA
jgi:excisionase family DNA binding protein